jgi:hypothetical protein
MRIVYSIDIFDMDFIAQKQKVKDKLIRHIQKSEFLQEIKSKIQENPDNYKNIIDTAKLSASTSGRVMDGAALIEWEKLSKEQLIELFHNADLPVSLSSQSSNGKKQRAAKVLQRNIRKFAHKNETSKLQRKQKEKRREEADKRRERATRKINSRESRTSTALEVLRRQREQHRTPIVSSRYSNGVLVSSPYKMDKHGLGGGNKKRRTMKKQRK